MKWDDEAYSWHMLDISKKAPIPNAKSAIFSDGSKMTWIHNPAFDDPSPFPTHMLTKEVHGRQRFELIGECMKLYSAGKITAEEYINLNRIILSEDDENYYVAEQIVNNLNPKEDEQLDEPF